MIRIRILMTATALLLAGIVNSVFAIELTEWKYKVEVAIEEGAGEYCKLILTPDVYNDARPDLGDIRLVNTSGEQVPYVLVRPKDTTESQKYEPDVINRSTNADIAAMVTLDFGKKTVKNSIEVITDGNNFRRAVKVEGSNDNIEFFTLVEQAYIFAVTYNRRFEQIDLPKNDYRYLRITVRPMITEEKSPVIDEVRAFKTEKSLAERNSVEMTLIEQIEDEKSNSSIYVYDLVYRRLPVSEIELEVADDSFYRYVTIEGRDAETREVKVYSEDNRQRTRNIEVKWERIINNTIYRYTDANEQKHERLALSIPSGSRIHRYLKITIRNYDDRPVGIKSASAKMIAHKIVFTNIDDVVPTLYVGSEDARTPQYDLEYRLSNPLQVKARAAKLSGLISNPLFGQVEKPSLAWTEKHKVLLLIIMVVMALVLGGFILKSFKSIQSEQVERKPPGNH
ncbi:MAG: DUF3999 family protein [Planctomycetes bacterium]|nr:DUF3999 family protein [Planctomycetota bacterium]MBL7146730.1 DUF3999 family protein [Phycisphaerae bacterium]